MKKTGDIKTAYEMDYADTSSVRAHYDLWAEAYDEDTGRYGYIGPENAARVLADHLPGTGASVLDVGCGTGLVGLALSRLGFTHLDGTDLSDQMIAKCKATCVYRSLFCEDLLEGVSVEDGSYDAVISVGTFGPLGPNALAPALAPVKRGGVACISVNEIFLDGHDFDAAFEALSESGAWRIEAREVVPHLVEGNHNAHVTVLRRLT